MYTKVEETLERQPAVAIIGPRQVGKTTIALEIAQGRPSVYLDLESYEDRDKLNDPIFCFSNMKIIWWIWMKFIVCLGYSKHSAALSIKAGKRD